MRVVGSVYGRESLPESWDVIVIGSGIGGLSVAALLAKHAGKRVLVLERHYVAGGFTHVFRRPGYEWDVGVHYIGMPEGGDSPVRAAFDHLTAGRLQWSRMPAVYDRIRIGTREYEFPSGRDRFGARMKEYFPGEQRAIDRYLAAVQAAAKSSGLYFVERAIPRPAAALFGWLLRAGFLKYASKTTDETLRSLTDNAELRAVLAGQWPDYGLPPAQSSFGIHAMVANHYFDGAAYPVGGSGAIAEAIAPLIEAAGGRIQVSAVVSSILLDQQARACGVRMADGKEFRAPAIVSDAGIRNTFGCLLPPEVAARSGLREEIAALPPSMSHLGLYVGLKLDSRDWKPDTANLWIYPNPEHDGNMERFAANLEEPFPALFISFPSAKDPSFQERCPGRSTIEMVCPVPYKPFEPWAMERWRRRGAEYEDLKKSLTARLIGELEKHVPSVRGHIDYAELSTPLSTRHFANYAQGEIYGVGATPERLRSRSFGSRTPVPSLYLTGQDAAVAGVTGAMFGGVATASLLLRRNMVGIVTKGSSL